MIQPVAFQNGVARFIDQRKLPHIEEFVDAHDHIEVAEVIRSMVVRGAPAIGISAAYGFAMGIAKLGPSPEAESTVASVLAASRPTAQNLFWAIDQMKAELATLRQRGASQQDINVGLEAAAKKIHLDDIEMNRAMAKHGAAAFAGDVTMITYCNTGGLATGGIGTALGVATELHQQGRLKQLYACETRPFLQGARLTAWEALREGLNVTLVTDNMVAWLMKEKSIDGVVVGADRIASNGDSANKIGTRMVALVAKAHHVPFYVAAPPTTFDLSLADGSGIPIEQRTAEEVRTAMGHPLAPKNVNVWNPAFDVTEASLIAGIVTPDGVLRAPYLHSISQLYARNG